MYNPLTLSIFLLILCCNFSRNSGNPASSAARITVSGRNMIRKDLVVSQTVNGTNFWANKKTFSFDKTGKSIIDINKEECGLVLLKLDDGFVSRMIVAPGDEVKVNIVANPQGRPGITYEGDNSAGHQFFNSLDRPFILDINNPYQQDSNVTDIKHKIQLKMEQELSALKNLLDKGKINKAYETLAALDIRYYYAASLADAICAKYYPSRMNTNNQHAVALFREKYGKAWEQAFNTMPLHSSKALASEYFRDYARLYYEYYLGQYAQNKSGLLPSDTAGMQDFRQQERKHILNYSIIDRNFKDSIAEYLKAAYLYYAMSQRTYEQSLLTLYTKFRQQYPDSRYRSFFKREADKILVYQKTKDKDFTAEQQFLSGYERINSWSALSNTLKNGPYYVDIWATWCGPCKAEFKFNASLSALLREYNVKPLYLSIDKDSDEEDWKNIIKYYKLPGIHLRANDSLRKDIANKLGKNKRFSIPRYLIINKNGGVVNSDAERPSRIDDLREQLTKL